jgi:hypothetical protein
LSKASEKVLANLHARLAEVLTEALGPQVDENGIPIPPNPAMLNVARQFLKDNKIEGIPAKGTPLGNLTELPVFDEDNLQLTSFTQ